MGVASAAPNASKAPRWTVLANVVSKSPWIGTSWEFFDDADAATERYDGLVEMGNCPTKRPFYAAVDRPHMGAVHSMDALLQAAPTPSAAAMPDVSIGHYDEAYTWLDNEFGYQGSHYGDRPRKLALVFDRIRERTIEACEAASKAGIPFRETDSSGVADATDEDHHRVNDLLEKWCRDGEVTFIFRGQLARLLANVRRETTDIERCRRIDAYATLRAETIEECARVCDGISTRTTGDVANRCAGEIRALLKRSVSGGSDGS